MNKMKTIKVFHGEKRLKDIYPYATRWEVFKFRLRRAVIRTLKVIGIICAFVLTVYIARIYKPEVQTIEIVKEIEVDIPILEKIAECESGNRHYGESGQVLLMGNKNGTVDIGRYQINTVWFKRATELGFNLMDEEDNRAMAEYILTHHGTAPWKYSAHCWSK